MKAIFSWIGYFLGLIFIDSPSIPYAWGEFNKEETLFDDFHSRPLARLLEYAAPELFNRFYWVVLQAAYKAKAEEEKLEELVNKKEKLEAEVASNEAAIDNNLDKMPPEPTEAWYENWLTVGLSLMLFLGISEFLGIEIQSFAPEQIPLALLALAGAACINVGEKLAISRQVEFLRRYEPRRNYDDDKDILNMVPFWERFRKGDPAMWLGTVIVLIETAFAAPGLISLLPPRTHLLIQLIVFLGTGLAALVNVALAWGTALEKIRWKQEVERRLAEKRSQGLSDIEIENRQFQQKAKEARARLLVIDRQLAEQKKWLSNVRERARKEHERWEIAVRRWILSNPQKVERFNQLYPQWNQEAASERQSGNIGNGKGNDIPQIESTRNQKNF